MPESTTFVHDALEAEFDWKQARTRNAEAMLRPADVPAARQSELNSVCRNRTGKPDSPA